MNYEMNTMKTFSNSLRLKYLQDARFDYVIENYKKIEWELLKLC